MFLIKQPNPLTNVTHNLSDNYVTEDRQVQRRLLIPFTFLSHPTAIDDDIWQTTPIIDSQLSARVAP